MSASVHPLLFQMWVLVHLHTSAITQLLPPHSPQNKQQQRSRLQISTSCKNRCLYAVVLYCEVNTLSVAFFLDDCNPIIFFYLRKPIQQMGAIAILYFLPVWQGCGIASSQFVDTAMDNTVISWANDSLWEFHQKVWHCPEQYISLKHIL